MSFRSRVTVLSCLLLAATSIAAAPATPGDDRSELDELVQVLSVETEIATQSKMNADFVPGMVTILDGTEMEELGAQTVLDALSLVPGIQTFRETFGAPNLVVRGIAYPFNAGNTKVMLDGIGLSRENAGNNSSALLTRIEQVDRIEVIRGPSSSIHGAFAFAGVINIITRKTHGRAFGAATTDDTIAGGGHHTFTEKKGKWSLTVNTGFYGGKDAEGPQGFDADGRGSTTVLQLERGNFSVIAEHISRDQDVLAPGASGRTDSAERTTTVQARQRCKISPTAESEVRLTYLTNSFNTTDTGKEFTGDLVDALADLRWRPDARHDLLLRVQSTRDVTEDGRLTFPPAPIPPLLFARALDHTRRINAISLQDQFAVNKKLTLTLGLRIDDYSDVGSRGTPRAGAVYRITGRDIVKAQYTQGFRPPTFFELFAPGFLDESLAFEVMSTTEFGYVHKRAHSTSRLTAFRSEITDMLFPVLPPPGPGPTFFRNDRRAKMKGVEAEWQANLSPRWRAMANVSHVETFDTRDTSGPAGDSATAADWMGNLASVHSVSDRLTLSGRVRYVGNRHVFGGSQVPGYTTLDLTASLARFPAKGFTSRFGVHNALDERVTYLSALPNATNAFEFEPRMAWFRTACTF